MALPDPIKNPAKPKPASTTPKANNTKGVAPYVQPSFDARIFRRHFLSPPPKLDVKTTPYQGYSPTRPNPNPSKTLTRGQIRQAEAIPGFSDVARLNFLFNPSAISASYAIIADDASAILTFPNADDVADLNAPINQSVSLSLLFDRTYELWDSSKVNTEVGKYGCQVDVKAMKQLVGMSADLSNAPKPNGNTTGFALSGATDIMRNVRCFVNIGGINSLSYYGFIESWDVTYTHWTQYMIPMRCVINMSLRLMPSASSGGGKPATADPNAPSTPAATPAKTSTAPNIVAGPRGPTLVNGKGGR